MAKNMEVAVLYDYYGDMLTDKQRDMIEQYYYQDLSLAEIAENAGISRQGVRDSIKRAEVQLFEMESHLNVAANARLGETSLQAILASCDVVRQENGDRNPVINTEIERIVALAAALLDR